MQMDYYGYEYSVLSILQDELKIESISKDDEIYDAFDINNNKIKSIVARRTITLNFSKDFRYCFDVKLLFEAFENGVTPEKSARYFRRDISDAFVKEFILK